MPTLTVITPHCDRLVALGLLERWMAAQTRPPDEWILADGGMTKARPTAGQVHLHQPRPRGAANFAHNLLAALAVATGDLIAVMEDDDYYAPTHLACLERQLRRPNVIAAGDDTQRYYNLALGRWRIMRNKGASLCQTGLTRAGLPLFRAAIDACLRSNSFGVDGAFWRRVPVAAHALDKTLTVVGMKGLPGSQGLGVGHTSRFMGSGTPDPHLRTLESWIGRDVEVYRALRASRAA